MEQQENKINLIIDLLKSNNLSTKQIESFIHNNFDFILQDENFVNKLYFILNNKELYSIIYVNENTYSWSINTNNTMTRFVNNIEKDKNNIEYTDFIIESVLNFTKEPKFKTMIPNKEQTVEQKIKTLKNMHLNSKGLHVK